jgi:lysophospholipase L1-like esterase
VKRRNIFKTLTFFMATTTLLGAFIGCSKKEPYEAIAPDLENGNYSVSKNNVRFLGRYFENKNTGAAQFSWSNAGFTFRFYGTGIEAFLTLNTPPITLNTKEGTAFISVFVDDKTNPEDAHVIKLDQPKSWYTLIDGLEEGYHTLTVRKRDRGYFGVLTGVAFGARELKVLDDNSSKAKLATIPEAKDFKIEVIGDSISAGDGIYTEDTYQGLMSDGWSTYAAETARLLDADLNTIAISGNGLISSIFGDHLLDLPTQWPYIDAQIYQQKGKPVEWDFSEYQADVVVINLGTNDRAGVGPDKKFSYEEFENEYVRFAEEIKSKYPDCIIIACLGAMGSELKPQIENVIERVNSNTSTPYMYSEWFTPDPKDGSSADNQHPSLKAHRRYGRQLAERIQELTGRNLIVDSEE